MRYDDLYILHYGTKGMSWGNRRYQNPDGSLTEEGKRHYGYNTSAYQAVTKGTTDAKKRGAWGGSTTNAPIKTTSKNGKKGSSKVFRNYKTSKASKVLSNKYSEKDVYNKTQIQKNLDSTSQNSTNNLGLNTSNKMSSSSVWDNPTNGSGNYTLGMLADFSSEKDLKKYFSENNISEDEQKALLTSYKDVQSTLENMPMDWQEQLYMDIPDLFKGGNEKFANSIKKNFTKAMESIGFDTSGMTKKQKILAKAITAKMIDDGLKNKKSNFKTIKHTGVAHDNNPPGPGSGRYPWGSGDRQYQHEERVYTSDTIKLDDLKIKDDAKSFVDKSDIKIEPILSGSVKQKANLGAEQTRVNNPSGNGTIPLYKKLRQHSNQGYAWNTDYPDIKRRMDLKIEPDVSKSMTRMYKGVDATVRELMKYQRGQLDDKARRRLDKKIRNMSDEELAMVSKRFTQEYNTIKAINDRNKITVPAGQDRTTTITNILGDQLHTAAGVVGLIAAIKKIKG